MECHGRTGDYPLPMVPRGAVGTETRIRASAPATRVRFLGGRLGRRLSPHIWRLAVPLEQGESSAPWSQMDMALDPQPANQRFHGEHRQARCDFVASSLTQPTHCSVTMGTFSHRRFYLSTPPGRGTATEIDYEIDEYGSFDECCDARSAD